MSDYVLCISNEGNVASLIVGKVYQTLPDSKAQEHDMLRVVDEDIDEPDGYLFPNRLFVAIEIPEAAERALWGQS